MKIKHKNFLKPTILSIFLVIGIIYNSQISANTGIIYSATFSQSSPIIDGVFDDSVWGSASNVTYPVNNWLSYGTSNGYAPYLADFSIALLNTPGGLCIGVTITMVATNSNGEGIFIPGLYIAFDNNNNNQIDTLIDDWIWIETYGTQNGNWVSPWSGHSFPYATSGEFLNTSGILAGSAYIEVKFPFFVANETQQKIGVDIGLITSSNDIDDPYSSYTRTFDSSIVITPGDNLPEIAYANFGGPNFSTLIIDPSIPIPPEITTVTETENITATEINTVTTTETFFPSIITITGNPATITEIGPTLTKEAENSGLPIQLWIMLVGFAPIILIRYKNKSE